MRIRAITIAVLFLGTCFARGQTNQRYPNELPQYHLFAAANWHSLVPLVSTIADVRKVMGEPARAVDLAHYSDKYPGDSKAEQPLFEYEMDKHWKVFVYFVGSSYAERKKFPVELYGRVYSIDLIPAGRLGFPGIPAVFSGKQVYAADAAWKEFSDGSGLRYDVYTSATPYGDARPGDLNRISYGPTDAEIAKHAKPPASKQVIGTN